MSPSEIRNGILCAKELAAILKRSLTVPAPQGTFKAEMQQQQARALARAEKFIARATAHLENPEEEEIKQHVSRSNNWGE